MLKKLGLAAALATALSTHAYALAPTTLNCVVYTSSPTSGSPTAVVDNCVYGTTTLSGQTVYWPWQTIWDGTTPITVKAASTAAAAGDTGLVVALSPNSPTPNFAATQPVSLASLPALAAGSATIGTVNLGTLNGAATAANQNVTAAGTSASNAQGVQGVTGGVPLPAAGYVLANNASAPVRMCAKTITKTISANADTMLVQGVAGETIYVCDIAFSASGANNFYLESVSGTGSTCGSGSLVQIANTWYGASAVAKSLMNLFYLGGGAGLNSGAGNGLCLDTSTSAGVSIAVSYDQGAW